MTEAERTLLVAIARWVIAREDEIAAKLGTTSNEAAHIRNILEGVREEAAARQQ